MPTLSLAMIVKNEEKTLERVLSGAKSFCDEMVVVDTGSTDKTVEIAEQMGAKVFHFTWINDFAAARNHAFECCTSDWIMWLDADDVVPELTQQQIKELKETSLHDELDGIFLTYQYAIDEKTGNSTYSFLRERIIRRAANLKWAYPVHECIAIPAGRSLSRPDIAIQHRPLEEKMITKKDRNIKILEKAIESGDESPRNLFYYANELRDHEQYEEAIAYYDKYLRVSNLAWEQYAAFLNTAQCYLKLDEELNALEACTKAMLLDSERAEAFNQIGLYFYRNEEWKKAIPFFHAASILPKPESGFTNEADYTWMPYDFLSICYHNLGQQEKAIEAALKSLPTNPDRDRVLNNLQWFIKGL